MHDLGNRLHGLAGRIAFCRVALDGHGTRCVEARDGCRAGAVFRLQERIERHHRAGRALDEDELQAVRLAAIRRIGLQHDFVAAAELVEVVDLRAAVVDLHGREHVRERNPEVLDLLAVNLVVDDRRCDGVCRAHALQLGPLVRGRDDLLRDVVELGITVAGHILELHRPAADGAEARQRRRVEREDRRLRRDFRADAERRADSRVNGCVTVRALRPVLHTDDDHARARLRAVREDGKAGDGHHGVCALDALCHALAHLVNDRRRMVRRCAFRHVNRREEIALVFGGDERRRQILVHEAGDAADDQKEDERELRVADEARDDAHVAHLHALVFFIELLEEAAEHAFVVLRRMRLQHHGAERRRQRQCHEGRKADGDGDRQGELLVQDAHHAAEERDGDEHGREDDGDGHDRALHFVHGALRRIDRAETLLHVLFDVFDDDDGVVDNEADREHHGKERQRIDGEIEDDERSERTDERHGDSEQRDDRRAPVLQEDENDEHDERERLGECMEHLLDRRLDVIRRVKDLRHLHAGRQVRLRLFKDFADALDGLHGVCIARELDAERDGRVAVEFRDDAVALLARLDARDILQAHELAFAVRAQDDVAEFFRRRQTAGNLARILFFLPVLDRQRADRAGRGLHVLLFDGIRDICNREAKLRELVRVQPDAQGVVRTEHHDIADALDTLDLVHQVDICVVLEERAVIAAILRIERQHIGHVVRRLARRDADLLDFGRQGRRRGRGVVLHFDGVHVAVRARLEHDLQAVAARVIGVRGHIVHALRAVDLLLDDLRDRIIDDGRRSARVRRRDGNGRRRNLRVLRDWQLRRGNRADDDDDQRDDDRENRAMNEEF